MIRSKQTTGQNVSIPMIHRGSVTTKHSKAESLPNQNSTKFFNVRGKTAPKSSDLQGTPGPGTYNRDLEIGGVSYVIGRGKRCHDRKQLSLGPGSYEISPCPSRISYTMTPRRKEMKRTEIVPGPGAYTPSELEDGIKFSISKANRNRARSSESPGPGAYSITTRNSSRSAL